MIASPAAPPEALTLRPAVAAADAPTVANGPVASPIAIPHRRTPWWPLAAGVAVIAAAVIGWSVTRGPDEPTPSATGADEHPASTAGALAASDRCAHPAPALIRQPAPTLRCDHPTAQETAPTNPPHHTVKQARRGSAAPNDDRMPSNGNVKA
jgi:hypothetical protein